MFETNRSRADVLHSRPKKILLVRVDRLGDMLASTPAIRALGKAYPEAEIDVLASDRNVAVLQGNEFVRRLLILPLKKYWIWPFLWMKIRHNKYDWVLDLNGAYSRTSGVISLLSGANYRITIEKNHARRFYNVILPQEGDHAIRVPLRLVARLGAVCQDETMIFNVPEDYRKIILTKYPMIQGKKRLGIFIGNGKKTMTRWPVEKFRLLAEAVNNHPNVEVFILAGPSERPLLSTFRGLWSDQFHLVMQENLLNVGAFLASVDLLLTSSSGPMHLAAAVGTPTLSILAEHTHAFWRPLGPEHHSICSLDKGVDVRTVPVDPVLSLTIRLLFGRRQLVEKDSLHIHTGSRELT